MVRLLSDVEMFAPIAGGKVLCISRSNLPFAVSLATGEVLSWNCDWDPVSGGWDTTLAFGMINGLAASPGGKQVAMSIRGGVWPPASAGEVEWQCDIVVLCNSDGSNARAVALCEIRDGATQLIFSQDGSRLYNNMYIPAEPTAAGYLAFIASLDLDSGFPVESFNCIDTATGSRSSIAGLENAEMVEPCPFSDNLAYFELDSDKLFFANLFDGPTGAAEAVGASQYFDWVLPDAIMLNFGGNQELVKVDGESSVVPGSQWRCFCTLPDGTCLFSDDGGKSISYGKVDWTSRKVDWRVERPDLSQFAEPFDSDGWPSMINTWWALPDSQAVLVREPMDQTLYYIPVSRDSAEVER